MTHKNIVLASSSSYRKKLLAKLNLIFESASPNIDEYVLNDETPLSTSQRLSELKAKALINHFPDHYIIGSDQVAVIDTKILTKPLNYQNNINQLLLASGKTMCFYTSVSVFATKSKQCQTLTDICYVKFRSLSQKQIENYVNQEKPYDCAGGFKSEAMGIALIESIQGEDPNALVGLPLIKLIQIFEEFGINIL